MKSGPSILVSPLLSLLLAMAAAACAAPPQQPPSPSPPFWLSDSNLARATAFRETAGLRADREWVAAVAMDAAATANVGEFGIPLTTSELELLSARVRSTEALSRLLGRYGAEHPDVWAGMYIEGARVVALLAGDVADDVRVIRRLVDPRAPLSLVRARWTLAALNRLSGRILEEGWLRDNYDLLDLGVNVRRNLVELQVSSANPNAPADIAAHYGAGEMLVVTTDGTGVTSLPTGDLAGQAVDAGGQPVAGLDVELVGSIPGSGPRGDIGLETARDGSFRFQSITATTYELRFLSHFDESGHYLEGASRILVGSASVEVKDGDATHVTVVVKRVLPAEGAQP